jgi:ABC-type microcin C transport system permease subunit YejB
MLTFALKRLAIAAPTLFFVVSLSFFLMHLAPGGPFDSERRLPPEIEQNLKAAYDLDKPLVRQYAIYLGKAARGDFGPSFKNKDFTVAQLIATGLPVSARLGLWAMALALLIGTMALFQWKSSTLDALQLGDDEARSVGVHLSATRWSIVLLASALAAGATSLCGPLAFVGLVAPHMARSMLGGSHRRTVLGSVIALGIVVGVLVLAALILGLALTKNLIFKNSKYVYHFVPLNTFTLYPSCNSFLLHHSR